ncbi:MAG: hypothetical protein FWC03_00655 [Treponema sp.]|nr:hypothetical protein [Treponema sp.]
MIKRNSDMQRTVNLETLDLHYEDEAPGFGFPQGGIYCINMDDITARIAAVKNTVKKINLNNQNVLTEIPDVIGECRNLEELDISNTEVSEIPGYIFSLPALRYIKTSVCPPADIVNAVNLDELNFWINRDDKFPQEICALKKLQKLTVCINADISLPETLCNLKNLKTLNVSFLSDTINFVNFPGSFSGHKSLKKIKIKSLFRYNEGKVLDMERLTKILASCPAFESLSLDTLVIDNGYDYLSRLVNLKKLSLRHLQTADNGKNATEINPLKAVSGMRKLEKLEIYGTKFNLTEIPDIFGNMGDLRKFTFVGNLVQNIPPSFYSLANLTEIRIYGTGISALGENIGNLQKLEKILLFDNLFTSLPESIFSLPCLNTLDIGCNNFIRKEISRIRKNFKNKINFMASNQGHQKEYKKLIAMNSSFDQAGSNAAYYDVYIRQCLAAVNEYPHAVKHVKLSISDYQYYNICEEAVKKSSYAIEDVNPEKLGAYYFNVCRAAAKCSENRKKIDNRLKIIRDDLLSEKEYLQVCLEAVLQSDYWHCGLEFIKPDRLSREDYELICRVAINRSYNAISAVHDPSPELCHYSVKKGALLRDIPEPMRSYDLCLLTVQTGKAGEELNFSAGAKEGTTEGIDCVPLKLRDEYMIKTHKEYIRGIGNNAE